MLTQVLQTYPHPIAYAYGNVYRTRSKPEQLDQILRCAEAMTRYLSTKRDRFLISLCYLPKNPLGVAETALSHLIFN